MIERMTRTDEMRTVFDRWRATGLSLMAFGKQEGVPYSRLLYWKKKFDTEPRPESADLVPIEVASEGIDPKVNPSGDKVEVWLANGICLDVGGGFDAEELRRLVGVLQSC